VLIGRVLAFLLGFMTWHSVNNLSRFPSKYLHHIKVERRKEKTLSNRKAHLKVLGDLGMH